MSHLSFVYVVKLSDLETSFFNLVIFILQSSCSKTLILVCSMACCLSDLSNMSRSRLGRFFWEVRNDCRIFHSWEFIKQMIHYLKISIILVIKYFCLRLNLIASFKNFNFRMLFGQAEVISFFCRRRTDENALMLQNNWLCPLTTVRALYLRMRPSLIARAHRGT